MNRSISRRLFNVIETLHATVYFAPEARRGFRELGLRGYWMGYFASRSAPLGRVPAEVVSAIFHNFHPDMVAAALPAAWEVTDPETVLATRWRAAGEALHRLLPEAGEADLAEAAQLAEAAARACPSPGRPLFAGHLRLAWPDDTRLRIWHACTLLREFRFDGHVAALTAHRMDGLDAHLTLVAAGRSTREAIQSNRGFSDEDWAAGEARLRERGWLDSNGGLTEAGAGIRQEVEDLTDELMLPPWESLGEASSERLRTLLRPLAVQVVTAGGVPVPNPMGSPRPA